MPHKFGPACTNEAIVFGAQRPGYNSYEVEQRFVDEWIAFMRQQSVSRVVCLLPHDQLGYYSEDVLSVYRVAFALDDVLSAPIEDFCIQVRRT